VTDAPRHYTHCVRYSMPSNTPDDIRLRGWDVAIHNDYRIDGIFHTFWLFTNPVTGKFVKGEGRADAEALDAVRHQLANEST